MTMIDQELLQEFKDRLADRYTCAELVDLLDIPVEDIISLYFELIPLWVLEEVGYSE